MLRNRRLAGWWIGLLIAVFVLTAFAPLRGETAPVTPGSGEMKLLLQPDYFADRDEGYLKLWSTMKVLALEMEVPVVEAKNPFKEGTRKIVYLDTGKGELIKKEYIIRERTRVKDGQPADKVEVTLRYRVAGSTVPGDAVTTAPGYKAKASFEEDIAGFVGSVVGNNVSEMSASRSIKDVPAGDLKDKTIGGYAKFFPTLAKLGIPLGEVLAPSNGITIKECKVSPGELDFGQGMKGEVAISLWYDYDTGKAIAAEVSFECGRGPQAPAAAVAKSEAFFNALQDRLSGILSPGGSKTQKVTGSVK
jgi:hypothetical protein